MMNYVTPSPTATDETRWKYPLGEAVVKVENDPLPGRRRPSPGSARTTCGWDVLSVPMRLVVELAGAVR